MSVDKDGSTELTRLEENYRFWKLTITTTITISLSWDICSCVFEEFPFSKFSKFLGQQDSLVYKGAYFWAW